MTTDQKTYATQATALRDKIERMKNEAARAERNGRDQQGGYYTDLLADLAYWEGVLNKQPRRLTDRSRDAEYFGVY